MIDIGYPHTGYGVELRTEKGWVLLDGIYRTSAEAIKLKQSIISLYGFEADDLRVVALTINRKEAKND